MAALRRRKSVWRVRPKTDVMGRRTPRGRTMIATQCKLCVARLVPLTVLLFGLSGWGVCLSFYSRGGAFGSFGLVELNYHLMVGRWVLGREAVVRAVARNTR